MTSSAQLERQAEQTRSDLARTLEELRDRITPGQLVDQAVDYAKDSGGAQFARNLGQQMVSNPLPVALIGAGMAWLMLSNGSRSGGRAAGEWASEAGERVRGASADVSQTMEDAAASITARTDDAKAKAKKTVSDINSAASRAASSASEGAASLYSSAKSRASDTYGRAMDATNDPTARAVKTASNLGRKSVASTNDFLKFCRDQPLVLAGLGVVLGAIMGSLIPSTETEDQLMGETSDELKEQTRDIAKDQYERSKQAVQSAAERPKPQPPEAQGASEHDEASLVPQVGDNEAEEFLD